MYKIVLVDDEKSTLDKLATVLPWQDMGFDVVRTFSNSSEVEAYIEKHHIDAILLDIKMAPLSGLDLAKIIYEKFKNIKIVLISAYQEFSYAQEAIKYGVVNYMLKPINYDEWVKVFSAVKNLLDESNQTIDILSMTKKQLFFDIFMGILSDEKVIEDRFVHAGFDEQLRSSQAVVLLKMVPSASPERQVRWTHGEERFLFAVEQILNENNNGFVHTVLFKEKDFLSVYVAPKSQITIDVLKNQYREFIQHISEVMCEIMGFTLHIDNFQGYESAIALCREYAFKNIFSNMTVEKFCDVVSCYINEGNTGGVRQLITMYNQQASADETEFVARSKKLLEKISGKTETELLDEIEEKQGAEGFKHFLIERLTGLADNLGKSDSQMKLFVKKACEYIDLHYNEDITLDLVAQQVYVTPKYLSVEFKKAIGITFSEYLTNKRIQQAILFLSDPMYKIYQIGELVGYTDSKSFLRMFKKYTGYTPTEYRNRL